MAKAIKNGVPSNQTRDKETKVSGIIFSKENLVSLVLVAVKLVTHFLRKSKEN